MHLISIHQNGTKDNAYMLFYHLYAGGIQVGTAYWTLFLTEININILNCLSIAHSLDCNNMYCCFVAITSTFVFLDEKQCHRTTVQSALIDTHNTNLLEGSSNSKQLFFAHIQGKCIWNKSNYIVSFNILHTPSLMSLYEQIFLSFKLEDYI